MNIAELPSADLLPSDLLRQYANVPTSIISDNMDRVPGAVGLLPMREGLHLVGTALTVLSESLARVWQLSPRSARI